MDSDAELARLLQQQFDNEAASEISASQISESYGEGGPSRARHGSGNSQMGIVDERWELIDPNPDIRALFMQFNDRFFWGRLEGVEVRWSPRMTLCAGLCCYEGYGGLCSVRLSQPLLKLRPRKDLVETLLHEMIHAYLFVTQNNKDHDGHGPEFCKHMNRINAATGTKISIYHTFHDEVDSYRQHWWRCNGPCQKRKPYFGYVKRSMNRAPSPRDIWWAEHQRTCGGTYTKIKEPEGYGEKGKKKSKDGDSGDSKDAGNNKPSKHGVDIRNFIAFSGKGQTVGGSSSSSSSSSSTASTSAGAETASTSSHWNPKVSGHSDRNSATNNGFQKTNSTGKNDSVLNKTSSYTSGTKMPTADKANASSSVWKTSTAVGDSESGTRNSSGKNVTESKKGPRFIPKIATASGRVVTDTTSTSSGDADCVYNIKDSDGESKKPEIPPKFIPVVAAVRRKDVNSSTDKYERYCDNNLSSVSGMRRNGASSEMDDLHTDLPPLLSSSSVSSQPNVSNVSGGGEGGKTRKDPSSIRGGKLKTDVPASSGSKDNVQNRGKRARLVDLAAMFDSDSDEDELRTKPVKIPRYSVDEERGNSSGVSESSDKENGMFASSRLDDLSDVVIVADNDGLRERGRVTSGIWADLSHLTSSPVSNNKDGNRQFGRVPPPLWKKKGSTWTSHKSPKNVPPQSSFSRHPWQVAAEKGAENSSSVAKATGTSDVICLNSDDEEDGGATGGGREGSVGPKTVPCPVCHLQIEEKKINTHLDTCLTYNCDALFSP